MTESNQVSNPIVPGTRVDKNAGGKLVDETQYKQIVGSLMYLTSTRPDIMFATGFISRYMSKPTDLHLQLAKRILRYLKGTQEHGIFYQRGPGNGEFIAYTDSDYAGDHEDRKSTSGYVFMMSSGAIAWSSRKQPIVTLSTTEAEFVAATAFMHGRSKHIDIRYHFLRDLVNEGSIKLVYCGSANQVADIMTKPLKTDTFQKLREAMGMRTIAEIS
ncbi:hypothetical protein LIER_40172 [Lithospermum erythrorhizon]|uniref:Uncharacterized protein n=1 Tax=Lithospermum erythrorhizon TaxID=34254 RepID=A0AAV3QQP0_LITER